VIGWSLNLSLPPGDMDFEVELPGPPLFDTSQGPVLELVFWSELTKRWIHAVADHFWRELPEEHVQVTVGDLAWLRGVVGRHGPAALIECVADLERCMIPAVEA
jgi:hypothetical protein